MTDSPPDLSAEVNAGTNTDVSGSSPEQGQSAAKPSESIVDRIFVGVEESPASEQEPEASVDQDPKPAETQGDAQAEPDISEEDLKRFSEKTQRRFGKLVDDNRVLRGEIDTIKPKAEQFDALERFATTNRLSADDVAETLQMAALIRTNPAAALQKLLPVVKTLMDATGEGEFPEDIAERVRLGYVTEADARRLHQAERQSALLQAQAAERAKARAAEEADNAFQTRLKASTDAVNAWAGKKATDPDWPLRQDMVHQQMELECRRKGVVPGPEEAIQMLDRIDKSVTEQLRKLAPAKPRAMAPVSATSTRSASPAGFKSIEEAIEAGMTG